MRLYVFLTKKEVKENYYFLFIYLFFNVILHYTFAETKTVIL